MKYRLLSISDHLQTANCDTSTFSSARKCFWCNALFMQLYKEKVARQDLNFRTDLYRVESRSINSAIQAFFLRKNGCNSVLVRVWVYLSSEIVGYQICFCANKAFLQVGREWLIVRGKSVSFSVSEALVSLVLWEMLRKQGSFGMQRILGWPKVDKNRLFEKST